MLTIFNSSGGFVQKKLQLIFVKPWAGVEGGPGSGRRPPPSRRGERVGAGALCAGGWPGLAQAADLAGSAARPNGGHSPLPRSTRRAPPAPLTRAGGWRAAPNRGFRLPARSAAPRATAHPAEGERRRRGKRERTASGEPTRWGGGEGSEGGAAERAGRRKPGFAAWRGRREAIASGDRAKRRPRSTAGTRHSATSPGGYEAAPRVSTGSRGARDRGQEHYVRAGGLGWRERLISQAPQLGRTGGHSPLPRSTRRAPPPR